MDSECVMDVLIPEKRVNVDNPDNSDNQEVIPWPAYAEFFTVS